MTLSSSYPSGKRPSFKLRSIRQDPVLALILLIACLLLATPVMTTADQTGRTLQPVAWNKLQGLGDVEYLTLDQSAKAGVTQRYHLFVRLPSTRDQQDTLLPTLYLLDGGTNFPMLAAYYHYLQLTDVVPEMIIVGISYGTDDFREGNARSHDFTAPAAERDVWGGAADFDRFLAEQLMPHLQETYPIDPERQALFGQSLGGQFALYTAMYGEAPFAAVIASNPALHRNLDFFLRPLERTPPFPLAFISSSENDAPRYRDPALVWIDHWKGKAPAWSRRVIDLPDHSHLSANPDVFLKGLLWLEQQSQWGKREGLSSEP